MRVCWYSLSLVMMVLSLHESNGLAQDAASIQAEIVVGGLMNTEGGSWDPATSPLNRPFGLDFDSDGNMFIVELEGGRIHRLPSNGTLQHFSGDGSKSYTGDGGPAKAATYNGMHNCAITPDNMLYIADSWNHCVRKIDLSTNHVSTVAGTGKAGFSGDGGPATEATFDFTMCITLNASADILHIADLNNRRIRALNLKSGVVTTIAGNGKKGIPVDGHAAIDSPLVDPRAVAADHAGNVYILERSGHALRVVRKDGTIQTIAGTGQQGYLDGPARLAKFGSPKHLCVDATGHVYIADDANKAIRRYDPVSDSVTTVLGQKHGDHRIQLLNPHGVHWKANQLFVIDTSNNRIFRLKL